MAAPMQHVRSGSRTLRLLSPLGALLLGLSILVASWNSPAPSVAATPTSESIQLRATANAVTDTYVNEAASSTTHDNDRLRLDGLTAERKRAAVRFDLATPFQLANRPQDVTITSAVLHLKVAEAPSATTGVLPVFLNSGSSWSGSATWNSSASAWLSGSNLLSFEVANGDADTWKQVTVTADVQSLVSGTTNNGWSFYLPVGAENLAFYSSNAADSADRPYLAITYTTSTSELTKTTAGADSGGYEDTYVNSAAPTQSFGTLDNLVVDNHSGGRSDAFLRFNLGADSPSLSGARIVSATLTLQVASGNNGRTLYASRLCGPASMSIAGAITNATYNQLAYPPSQQNVSAPFAYQTGSLAPINLDVTTIVQNWADGEANLGFRIYQAEPPSGVSNAITLHSFNASDPGLRPQLEIEYVHDQGTSNALPSPTCQAATPTPTPTNTSTSTPVPGTATNTPVNTPTNTPTSTPTQTPTNTPTPTATPPGTVSSAQVVVTGPEDGTVAGRSRLAFTATHGTISPTALGFAIQRDGDDHFWNGSTGQWQSGSHLNPAALSSGTWTYTVSGEHRRAFANAAVTVEAHATVGPTVYISQDAAEATIR